MNNFGVATLAFIAGVLVAYLSVMLGLAIVIGMGKTEEAGK